MTQEDKQLLLSDLCARLPYGVVMNTPNGDGHLCSINQTIFGNEYGINISATRRDYFNDEKLNFKPYLRPMSSMTEEEENIVYNGHIQFWDREDYCNKHHLDYRGLIKKGLALEAPKGMYNIN